MAHIDVVVGGQFGSEGKGHVTAQLVNRHLESNIGTVMNIRVAGPNAGHTVYDAEGNKFALRTVPVGAAVSDDVHCYIAPGSEIELEVLVSEIELLRNAGHQVRNLAVSGEATVLTEEHKQEEANRNLSEKLGSTGKGIGACRADRIFRSANRVMDDPDVFSKLLTMGVRVVRDSLDYMENALGTHSAIIVEGTQGYGLGLHAGWYPTCTSSDTRAIDFLAMAGISPWSELVTSTKVWVCARVYPIRVAGNSGAIKDETSWDELGLAPEYTTVTNKVRRVGQWDDSLIKKAVCANGGYPRAVVALTMADQKIPEIEGTSGDLNGLREDNVSLSVLVDEVEQAARTEVGMVTTSPVDALFR